MRTKFDYQVERNCFGEVDYRTLDIIVTGSKKETREQVEEYAYQLGQYYYNEGMIKTICIDCYEPEDNTILLCIGKIEADEKEDFMQVLRDFKEDLKNGNIKKEEEIKEEVISDKEEEMNTEEVNETTVKVNVIIKNNEGKEMANEIREYDKIDLMKFLEVNRYTKIDKETYIKYGNSGTTKQYKLINRL